MAVTINGSTGLTGVAAIDNVSSTELGYVDGVTSAIQTQINNNAPGATGIPYRMAAGKTAMANHAGGGSLTSVTITFPSGRFSQTPVFTAQAFDDAQNAIWGLYTNTTTSVSVYVKNNYSSSVPFSVYWMAVQMTSSSAAG